MSKNELKNIYHQLTSRNPEKRFFSSTIDFDKVINAFADVKDKQECPDGIIEIGNVVYILEHFEVSLYRNKNNGDLLRIAQNNNYINFFKRTNIANYIENLNSSLENLLNAFNISLDKHMKRYNEYVKNAQKDHQDKEYKLIFVVEDTSHSIINEDGISLLDTYECAEKILSYSQIDGVILYHTSNRGDFITAKDRKTIENELSGLKKIQNCEVIMQYIAMHISKSPEGNNIKKILESLLKSNEAIEISEEIQVIAK